MLFFHQHGTKSFNKAIGKPEAVEKYNEGIQKLIIAWYMLLVFDDKDIAYQASQLYTGMIKLSEILKQYMPYLDEQVIEINKNIALGVIAEPALQPQQFGISEEVINYLTALQNAAKDVLWQIENYQEPQKHTVGKLLEWLETAPNWAGDDFEECLEYVNRVRK